MGSSNSGPIFEDQKKEKKGGFMGLFSGNKANQAAVNDDFERQYEEYIKKKAAEPEFKQPNFSAPNSGGFGNSFPVAPPRNQVDEERDVGDLVNEVASGLKK